MASKAAISPAGESARQQLAKDFGVNPNSRSASKSELARLFGISLRTLGRWLGEFNDSQPDNEKIDLSVTVFTPKNTTRLLAHFI